MISCWDRRGGNVGYENDSEAPEIAALVVSVAGTETVGHNGCFQHFRSSVMESEARCQQHVLRLWF